MKKVQNMQAALLGIAFAAIWSGSFIATKIALPYTTPMWLAGMRLIVAGGLLICILLISGRGWKDKEGAGITKREVIAIIGSAILSQSIYIGVTYHVLTYLPAGIVSIIVSTLPLVTFPFAWYFLGETSTARDVLSVIIGIAGIVMLTILRDPTISTTIAGENYEILIMYTFIATISLGLGNTILKRAVRHNTLIIATGLQILCGGIVIIPLAYIIEGDLRIEINEEIIVAFGYLTVAGSLIGTYIWLQIINMLKINTANVFFLLTPVFGVVMGLIILDESITKMQIVSVVMIGSCIVLRTTGTRFRQNTKRGFWPKPPKICSRD